MEKIKFINNQAPDLSAETLNEMQDNIEDTCNELSQEIKSLASGSPKGVYTNSAAIKNANPDTGVYIASGNGHIYSWTKDSTSDPIDLGVYQATSFPEVEDGRISRTGQTYSNIGDNIKNSTEYNFNEFNNYSTRVKTSNLYDKNDVLLNKYVNSNNGKIENISGYLVTNYIQIDGTEVHRSAAGYMAWYDSNKQYISGVSYNQPATQTKPENAVYVRATFQIAARNSAWVADSQNSFGGTPYYRYPILDDSRNQRYLKLEQSIDYQSNYAFKDFNNYGKRTRTSNLLDKNACLYNYAINPSNGELTPFNDYYASPFIKIENATLNRSTTGNMAWYDVNKEFISGVQYNQPATQTKPENAVYCRISISSGAINSATVGDGENVASGTPYYNYEINIPVNITKNKHTANIFQKVVCIGDSYTSGYIVDDQGVSHDTYTYSWPAFMEKITGNKYVNCALGGRNVLTWQTSNNCYSKAVASGKAQAYIIGLGINDSGSGDAHVDVGTISDIGSTAQTYYGGMSQIIDKMLVISPKAKIFIQTVPNSDTTRYNPYNTAIRNIVNYYRNTLNKTNIHCLDLAANIEKYQTASLVGDQWHGHYTAMGYEQFAEILNDILSDYINSHISEFRDVAFIEYDE